MTALVAGLMACSGGETTGPVADTASGGTGDASFIAADTVAADPTGDATTTPEADTSTPVSDTTSSGPADDTAEPEDTALPGPFCGDGTCGADEDCDRCPEDCGACASCGDGECQDSEKCESCPEDCGECPVTASCGDGTCDADEDCVSCEADCGACEVPGDCCDEESGTLGCDDEGISACVCELDDWCCNFGWDGVCVAIACESCGAACASCEEETSEPAYGDLVITEVMQNPDVVSDDVGEWFEVMNVSTEAIDLEGMELSDDGEETHIIASGGPLVIEAGARMVLGQTADLGGGGTADYAYGEDLKLGNKSDGIFIYSGETLIDAVSYDDGDTFPDPTGASMRLDDGMVDADANDSGTAWCVSVDTFGAGDLGTPGAENGSCPAECGDGTCSGTETCENCEDDCGACAPCGDGVCEAGENCDNCLEDCSPCTTTPEGLQPGDFIITEIMKNPGIAEDSVGEWVELKNTTGETLDLAGATLSDNGSDTFVIEGPVSVEPGGYVVLGASADLGLGGEWAADVVFSGIAFGNGSDSVMLWYDGVVIDEVAYSDADFPDSSGKSMNLDPGVMTAAANDDGSGWCEATTLITTVGEKSEYGTPGQANPACPTPSVCGDGTCADDENCADCEADCDPCDNCTPVDELCNGLDDDCDGETDEDVTLCDDGIGCTANECLGVDGCSNPIAEEYCVIDDTCHPKDGPNPSNPCESCQPFTSTSEWTVVNGGSCNDGDSCTDNDMCSEGVCMGQTTEVTDANEPNDSLATATDLGEIDDGSSFPAGTVQAAMGSTESVDWYTYLTEDTTTGGDVESRAEVTLPEGASYRLCIHFRCNTDPDFDETEYDCYEGSELSTTSGGLTACCDSVPEDGKLVAKSRANCPGIAIISDDGGTTFVEVSNNGSDYVCEGYTLDWGDN